jgi:orotidine-5'-phosphate decarboxylase
MNFTKKLLQAVQTSHSTVCVGLDPNLELLPDSAMNRDEPATTNVRIFLEKVIDATAEHCAAYKPNVGFFEALGPDGWDTFQDILDYIPDDKIVIADAKRGDISSTAEHYAKAFFGQFNVDAVTLNPLMGFETLDPFLDDPEKAIYVLTLTSNPGANDILQQKISNGPTVAAHISENLNQKQQQCDTAIGMVVGATKAADLEPVIRQYDSAPLLIPGVGKQGGSIEALGNALEPHHGIPLVNSSRSIIYAGSEAENWQQSVADAANQLKQKLNPITERYV